MGSPMQDILNTLTGKNVRRLTKRLAELKLQRRSKSAVQGGRIDRKLQAYDRIRQDHRLANAGSHPDQVLDFPALFGPGSNTRRALKEMNTKAQEIPRMRPSTLDRGTFLRLERDMDIFDAKDALDKAKKYTRKARIYAGGGAAGIGLAATLGRDKPPKKRPRPRR